MLNTEMTPIDVQPTGSAVTETYSDSAVASLFKSHLDFAASTRQLIWQRYSAMLVANSFIIGFLSRIGSPQPSQPWFTLVACIFGLLICICWERITHEGWEMLNAQALEIKKFQWKGYTNPIDIALDIVLKPSIR